jgi:sigma-B regulation protein RsbU (phosphoserine phosphatase)
MPQVRKRIYYEREKAAPLPFHPHLRSEAHGSTAVSDMKVLIAEDEPDSRQLIQIMVSKWGYEAVATQDGAEAWEALQQRDAPQLALLDIMMPRMDGLEVCRRARERHTPVPTYIILLTAKTLPREIVTGLEAGADDYLTKPFDTSELRARIKVGERILELQSNLAMRVEELEEALTRVKQLQGLLPICSYCKKIRDDQNYWQQVESYISKHSEAQFSHGICPDCYTQFVTPDIERLKSRTRDSQREPEDR